eukprot:TRINITY_DN8170_c0_g1_i1.p1 TRINITY_DN8170_c0_g1~~TRINITY_DN8170_c0_g1_i1.p1  ORF type:complete len:440 (-),score=58.10 TRINITY_DN8170_c0_g1_i1:131-1450(-)
MYSINTDKAEQTPVSSSQCDRFIPNRNCMDLDLSHYNLTKENTENNGNLTNSSQHYKLTLAQTLFSTVPDCKILALRQKQIKNPLEEKNNIFAINTANNPKIKNNYTNRLIPTQPEHILDAPDIIDDYYLNLLDWSSKNILAVALGCSVYLWNASTSEITCLLTTEGTPITSVKWTSSGKHLALGMDDSVTQLWDIERSRVIRKMDGHVDRVSSLAWNNFILSSGSRDSTIVNHDVRIQRHVLNTFETHREEVCGLAWSPDSQNLASGGNDNLLCIWDFHSANPKYKLTEHCAAVKALSWCPWQSHLLASGGGTSDCHIRFWNTSNGTCINAVDTQSQVCSLLWSTQYKELVSSHGFSKNQLCIWKYPAIAKVTELTAHSSRVLHMAASPDGSVVVSAAADETLCFWKIWESRDSGSRKKSLTDSGFRTGFNRRIHNIR